MERKGISNNGKDLYLQFGLIPSLGISSASKKIQKRSKPCGVKKPKGEGPKGNGGRKNKTFPVEQPTIIAEIKQELIRLYGLDVQAENLSGQEALQLFKKLKLDLRNNMLIRILPKYVLSLSHIFF